MAVTLATKAVSFGELFSCSNRFRIPANQRSYVWTEQVALEFYRDLYRVQNRRPHSLGPIIVADTARAGSYELLDGQQRLVTLALVVAILRDLLPTGALKDDLQEVLCGPKGEPRVSLRDLDQHNAQAGLTSFNGTLELRDVAETEAARRLFDVAKAIKAEIGEASAHEIRTLAAFILNECTFMCISAAAQMPMHVWLKAIHLLRASKTEISATELSCRLGVQVRGASFLTTPLLARDSVGHFRSGFPYASSLAAPEAVTSTLCGNR
jgi:hypothetical protein